MIWGVRGSLPGWVAGTGPRGGVSLPPSTWPYKSFQGCCVHRCHPCGSQTQRRVLSPPWGPQVQSQGVGRAVRPPQAASSGFGAPQLPSGSPASALAFARPSSLPPCVPLCPSPSPPRAFPRRQAHRTRSHLTSGLSHHPCRDAISNAGPALRPLAAVNRWRAPFQARGADNGGIWGCCMERLTHVGPHRFPNRGAAPCGGGDTRGPTNHQGPTAVEAAPSLLYGLRCRPGVSAALTSGKSISSNLLPWGRCPRQPPHKGTGRHARVHTSQAHPPSGARGHLCDHKACPHLSPRCSRWSPGQPLRGPGWGVACSVFCPQVVWHANSHPPVCAGLGVGRSAVPTGQGSLPHQWHKRRQLEQLLPRSWGDSHGDKCLQHCMRNTRQETRRLEAGGDSRSSWSTLRAETPLEMDTEAERGGPWGVTGLESGHRVVGTPCA